MDAAARRPPEHAQRRFRPAYLIAPLLLGVIAIFFSVRMFVLDWYQTPSGAMLPTLHLGDFFLVSKLAYRGAEPQRGDVIVFLALDGDVTLVKRVIGLPGDVVVYDSASKRLTINGEAAVVETVTTYGSDQSLEIVRETLGRESHLVMLTRDRPSLGGTYDVPDGHYFVLGDNRDNSNDSRYAEFGFVPREEIVGKVGRIWHVGVEPAAGAEQD